MKAVFINYNEAGAFALVDLNKIASEEAQDQLAMVDNGEADIIKCENGVYSQAVIEGEEVEDDPDDENNEDTHTEYKIARWIPLT